MSDKLPVYSQMNKGKHKSYKHRKPFWNKDLELMYSHVADIEKEFRKCKSRTRKRDLRFDLKHARSMFDKAYRKEERKFKRNQVIELENFCIADPKQFWDKLKQLGPKRKQGIPMEVYDDAGNIVCDKEQVLDKWCSEFEKLYNRENETNDPDWDRYIAHSIEMAEQRMLDPLYDQNKVLNRIITLEEIDKVVKKAKNKKNPGIDLLPNEVLKNTNLRRVLKDLFQICLDTGKIPSEWYKAMIKPLPKSKENDPRVPLNYRGISLLSCCLKLFTSIIDKRLTQFFDEQDEICDEQNGFRGDRSCTDHVFTLYSIVNQRLSNNQCTFATFIDFSKAFDGINRDLLMYKLIHCGVDGNMYFLLKSLYAKTEACVNLNNHNTAWFRTRSGVLQGDSLSPTLFSAFINDLTMGLKDLNLGVQVKNTQIPILLYADDVVILANDQKEMQVMLNFVDSWCERWKMSVNMSKTKLMHFRKKNVNRCIDQVYLGRSSVDYTDSYKYLGVYFGEFLEFDLHCKILSDSGTRALGAVIGKLRKLDNMSYESYTKCVESSVYPVVEYGAEVWGGMKDSSTDKIQLKAIRSYLGVHKFAPTLAILGDMGWTPSCIRRKICMLRYWNRLICLEDDRITKKIFCADYENNGKWCKVIKAIFRELECLDIYNQKHKCDLQWCEEKLLEKFATKWKTDIKNKPKLRTYVKLKQSYGTELYAKMNLTRPQRSILAQLRCGILPLYIETGRYTNIKLENRICIFCDDNKIENELHFTMNCSLYKDLRSTFFNNINMDFTYSLADNFKTLCIEHPRKLSKFVLSIWQARKDKLYTKR